MVTIARATRLISFNDMLSSALLKRPKGHPPLPEFGPSWTLVGPRAPPITGCCGGPLFLARGSNWGGSLHHDRDGKAFLLLTLSALVAHILDLPLQLENS